MNSRRGGPKKSAFNEWNGPCVVWWWRTQCETYFQLKCDLMQLNLPENKLSVIILTELAKDFPNDDFMTPIHTLRGKPGYCRQLRKIVYFWSDVPFSPAENIFDLLIFVLADHTIIPESFKLFEVHHPSNISTLCCIVMQLLLWYLLSKNLANCMKINIQTVLVPLSECGDTWN